jgi:hypothetical protein
MVEPISGTVVLVFFASLLVGLFAANIARRKR